eukprot:TRINITY_DN658_c0_g1_i4.p1 TRINITY_DN658_c0_g1~~TRINITY_DN658_c0_g1_i4.p1  ORF type:complete len:606 (+),score=142.25 TRINITY_DN658_c0_g1_i4:1738-3555(+)
MEIKKNRNCDIDMELNFNTKCGSSVTESQKKDPYSALIPEYGSFFCDSVTDEPHFVLKFNSMSISQFLFFLISILLLIDGLTVKEQTIQYREKVRGMFYHAYDNYMRLAFPKDEILPISCTAKDTWGSYSLTLIDSLDTLLIMGNVSEFKKGVNWLSQNLSFDKDLNVSVFETNIRVLGGLLSAHLMAIDQDLIDFPEYDGELLVLAYDLGYRLIPAFNTPTHIPYGTVNLRGGVPPEEVKVTCSAGAGTFSLEFGLLSYLTDDMIFETKAKEAVRGLWSKKSEIGLIGNHIDIWNGQWTYRDAGIGHGIDSFYEYLAKAAFFFGDQEYLDILTTAYFPAITLLKRGDFYVEVDYASGADTVPAFNSLQSFWPGMQVLLGDMEAAKRTALMFDVIRRQRGYLPEKVNLITGKILQDGYPLRPELVESFLYLSLAYPNEPIWYYSSMDFVDSLLNLKKECGFAAIDNIDDMTYMDRMDSFFLAETLKYLYLIFDPDNYFNKNNFIYNTEAHPFKFSVEYQKPNFQKKMQLRCPTISGFSNPFVYLEQNDVCSTFLKYVPSNVQKDAGIAMTDKKREGEEEEYESQDEESDDDLDQLEEQLLAELSV